MIGAPEIPLILAVVLLVFGAKKIPGFACNLGKASAEFKRGKMIVEREIKETEIKNEIAKKMNE